MTKRDPRNGLRTSATLATLFTFLGHMVLGFEQAVAHVVVALVAGYSSALFFEWVDATANGRRPGYLGGGPLKVVDWLLSAHMTAITLSFLVYTSDYYWVLAFIVVVAIGSKYLFRVRVGDRMRHFMNPSNLGIIVGVWVFQWTAVLPWGLTTTIYRGWDWGLTALVALLGFRLNLLYTKRLPMIAAWIVVFVAQGLLRSVWSGSPWTAELGMMSNVVFMLFTFYMIPDPMTSPQSIRGQLVFGASIGVAYGVMMAVGLMYTLFYAVSLVAATRGALLYAERYRVTADVRIPDADARSLAVQR